MSSADIAVFEFGVHGHFPYYLRLLFEHWLESDRPGRLHALVTPRLLAHHGSIFEGLDPERIRWSAVTPQEEELLNTARLVSMSTGGKSNAIASEATSATHTAWSLVCRYAEQLRARHMLLTCLDDFLLPLSVGFRAPIDFSGILMRPVFHYPAVWGDAGPALSRSKALFDRLYADRLLHHPQLRTAFFIDRSAMDSLVGRVKTELCFLPDPVRLPKQRPDRAAVARLRTAFGIPADRRMFLMAGDIAERKGIQNLMIALAKLPPADAARICVALVGRCEPNLDKRIETAIASLRADSPVSIVRRAGYVSEEEMADWFAAADVVLAPYVQHFTMSGIQLLAAAHGRPLLCSDFALMGDLTRRHGLGLACTRDDPGALSAAILTCLDADTVPGWDEARAAEFARAHSHEKFAATIFGAIERVAG